MMRHPDQPLLDHCPPSLPQEAYLSPDWFAQEMATLWSRQWVCAGRLSDFPAGTMTRVAVGPAEAILCRSAEGDVSAFHNTCRHRGSVLCRTDRQEIGKLIHCPYHAWSYAAATGRLVSVAFAHPTGDFRREDHGLHPVSHRVWGGWVFLSLSTSPGPLWSDIPLATLDNWPLADLRTGHRWEKEIACNWKVFWENYSECLHCPGIHPELCDLVPVYSRGVMAANEAQGWTPDAQPETPRLRPGAESWTLTGKLCGPAFPGLTEAEAAAGYTFVTLWPSVYIVAHADYVRSVRIRPLGPERTLLTAEWHFPEPTLSQPGFDAAAVAAFARIVLGQDGDAAEMNQAGLRSPAFKSGRLMPEEYEIHRFHTWLREQMEASS